MAVDTKAPETDVVGYGPEGLGPSTGFTASVLDLGFNSAKLATYHVNGRTSYRIISQEDAKVKLGEELDETGFLAVSPMERTLRVLKMFREIIDFESPRYVLPVATSAVREAANRSEFLHLAEETSKFKFRVCLRAGGGAPLVLRRSPRAPNTDRRLLRPRRGDARDRLRRGVQGQEGPLPPARRHGGSPTSTATRRKGASSCARTTRG